MSSLARVSLAMALLFGVALWVVGNGAQVAAGGQHRGIYYMRGAGPAAPVKPGNMTYLGGPVSPDPTVYAMWWGTPSDFPSDTHDGINHWFGVLNGSAYINLANQYLFGQQATVNFAGNLYDYSAPPTQDVPSTDIVAEVYSVVLANGMKPDPTALYAVFTSNFPNERYYCANQDNVPPPHGTCLHE